MRLRTDAAKRFWKVGNATTVIFMMLLLAEKRFRRLNAPDVLQELKLGMKFINGLLAREQEIGLAV